ncbi:MAG: class I tRNA ligase family protein, partial [Lentisphaeria bacterium]|nr:class I tRNA ligase family protein [Lentisphaeria bacterium]
GPLEAVKPWSTKGVEGVFRFLKRSWKMIAETPVADLELTKDQKRLLHATIKKVTEDTESLNFNTAISQMMIFLNEFSKLSTMPREAAEAYVLLLAPYAPHIAEEMWEILGNAAPVSLKDWPTYNEAFIKEDEVEVLIQVLGKPKARIMMPVEADAAEMQRLAEADASVQKALEGKTVVKVIAVPKRVVNFVVR